MTEPRLSFTQPMCRACWDRRHPGREPVRLIEPEAEVCCECGTLTEDAIYIRVDPATVAHPTRTK